MSCGIYLTTEHVTYIPSRHLGLTAGWIYIIDNNKPYLVLPIADGGFCTRKLRQFAPADAAADTPESLSV